MPTDQSIWVHGNIVEAQTAGPYVNVVPEGFGTCFKTANQSVWFHFPLTIPAIKDGVRPTMQKVFVFYKTAGNATITNVHIFDGNKKVGGFDNLALQGDHSGAADASNTWTVSPPLTIYYGLGISVNVEFGAPAASILPQVVFHAAGADFTTP